MAFIASHLTRDEEKKDLDKIFKEIDISNLVDKKGIIYTWSNKNLKSRKLEIKVRNDLGIKQKLLTKEEILKLEPNLNPIFDAGVLYEGSMFARDPHEILKRIFARRNIHMKLIP